ncbi:MAG: hypothetical protein MPJ50_13420 [Pirellulales bacterium]|nr:hypothetical protein [Pirellulales bacterium]
MDVGALGGILGSAAGAPRAQRAGTDKEREAQEATNQSRQTMAEKKAEAAADIGATEADDQSANERDADGRKLWEDQQAQEKPTEKSQESGTADGGSSQPRSLDPRGETGVRIDLTA